VTTNDTRAYWASVTHRLATLVLSNLAARRLRSAMAFETANEPLPDRHLHSCFEAVGRLLAGIAPWLELDGLTGPEADQQRQCREWVQAGLDAASDPQSPDFLNFTTGRQTLVDAAFLAHGLLRAPRQLWEPLEPRVKQNLLTGFLATRVVLPVFNNWLLFAAIIEAFLHKAGVTPDLMRVDYAIRQHDQWYVGDGHYADGPHYHQDYYNSFVIHPMLLDVIEAFPAVCDWDKFREPVVNRARRYAAVQERNISPEGTYPVVGRSITYRFGALQLLGQMALRHQLPDGITPAQVRCALTAVIRRQIEAPGTFDANGWLRIGFCGHQPGMADRYISTGSLYLCATGLLPLGLPPADPFWADPDADWTSKKAWDGIDVGADHSIA